jgi:hypothetical protein
MCPGHLFKEVGMILEQALAERKRDTLDVGKDTLGQQHLQQRIVAIGIEIVSSHSQLLNSLAFPMARQEGH